MNKEEIELYHSLRGEIRILIQNKCYDSATLVMDKLKELETKEDEMSSYFEPSKMTLSEENSPQTGIFASLFCLLEYWNPDMYITMDKRKSRCVKRTDLP